MLRLKIKEIAQSKGYNMSSLSRRSDVSFSTIKRLWNDPYKKIDTEILQKIATALGVSVLDLLEDENLPPQSDT